MTVPDPNGLVVTTANLNTYFVDQSTKWAAISCTVDGQDASGDCGPFPVTVTDTDGSIVSPTQFSTICYDPLGPIQDAVDQYYVNPGTVQSLPHPPYTTPLADAAQVAYLYNQYAAGAYGTLAQGTLTQVDATALQLAIFKLELDPQTTPYTAASFSTGNFQVTGILSPADGYVQPTGYDTNLNDYLTAAKNYANSALSQNDTALFLNPVAPINGNGAQGVLATGSYNFINTGSGPNGGVVPGLSTTPSATTVTLGTTTSPVVLTDTASLASSNGSPTGTITFTLVAPGGGIVDTETVSVNGDGSYTTPTGYTLPTSGPVIGTYQWDASYSGDSTFAPVSDDNNPNEEVTVTSASPAITTTPSTTSVTLGATSVTLNDTAALSGGYDETGTITFTLYMAAPSWTRRRPRSAATALTARRPATRCPPRAR